jgi:hypothetical protein
LDEGFFFFFFNQSSTPVLTSSLLDFINVSFLHAFCKQLMIQYLIKIEQSASVINLMRAFTAEGSAKHPGTRTSVSCVSRDGVEGMGALE